jgi:hypothetical protein
MTMPTDATRHKLPRTVVVLGLVSFTMDISSEMIHALLPLFLVTVLGASALSVGIVEGMAAVFATIALGGLLATTRHLAAQRK